MIFFQHAALNFPTLLNLFVSSPIYHLPNFTKLVVCDTASKINQSKIWNIILLVLFSIYRHILWRFDRPKSNYAGTHRSETGPYCLCLVFFAPSSLPVDGERLRLHPSGSPWMKARRANATGNLEKKYFNYRKIYVCCWSWYQKRDKALFVISFALNI